MGKEEIIEGGAGRRDGGGLKGRGADGREERGGEKVLVGGR